MQMEKTNRSKNTKREQLQPTTSGHSSPMQLTQSTVAGAYQRVKDTPSNMINPADVMVLQRNIGNRAVGLLMQIKMDGRKAIQRQENEEEPKQVALFQKREKSDEESLRGKFETEKNTGLPYGNAYVQRMVAGVKAKLKIHQPDSNRPCIDGGETLQRKTKPIQVKGSVQQVIIQRSQLSEQAIALWDAGVQEAFFELLRNSGLDQDTCTFVETELFGDDRWLAVNLLENGPELVWPLGPLFERELGRGFPDYAYSGLSWALDLIHAASLPERRHVLNYYDLSWTRSNMGSQATVIMAALLEGSLTWRGPSHADPNNQYRIIAGSTFAAWILGRDENNNKPDPTSTMNCWEGVMFACYLAGRVSYAQLLALHDQMASAGQAAADQRVNQVIQQVVEQILAQYPDMSQQDAEAAAIAAIEQQLGPNYRQRIGAAPGSEAYNTVLRNTFGINSTTVWNQGDPAPPVGNLVFFKNDPITHVAISMGRKDSQGRSEVMSLWVAPGNITSFQRTTIEELVAVPIPGGMTPVTHGPSPW